MKCGIFPTIVFNSRSKLKMIFLPMRTMIWARHFRSRVQGVRTPVLNGVIGAILCRQCQNCARPNLFLLQQNTSRLHGSVSNSSYLFSNRLLVHPRRYVSNKTVLDAAKAKKISLGGREMNRLLSLAKREKWNLTSAIFLLLISSTITMSIPFALGKVIDLIYTSDVVKMKENLYKLSAVLFAVFLVGGLCNFGRVYLMNVSGHRITKDLREKVFRSIMKQDIAFFDSNKTGELINRISADTALVSQCVTMNISDGLRSTVMACAGVSMMFYMSTELALVGLGIVPPVAAIAIIYGRFVRKITKSVQGALAESTQVAEERISNIRTVKAFSQEKKEIQAYGEKMDKVLNLSIKESLARGGFFGMTGFSGNVIILTVLYHGVSMVAAQEFTVGNLSAFLWYAAYVGVSLGGLSSFYAEMNKGLGASTRLWELIDKVPGIQDTGGIIPSEPLRGDIKFKNITFSYPNRPESTILNGFNLNVDSGSIMAVVGHSGSGKSTLFSLLLRLYDPNSGIVLVDGLPLQSFNLSWLRSHVGVVSQEPVLFSGTIRENIAYGAEDPSSLSKEEIEMAAVEANAYDFIANDFPEGFETRVGERGIMLSGGQKQRVAIARALIKNPSILLLDEATSALDAESEHLVQEALERIMKGRTVISIAHRLSTIKNADQIAVLKDGSVAQIGSYDELMKDESGAFKKLVQHQTFQATSPSSKPVEAESDMFDSQLATVVSWFDTWNETGQAVALIKMVTRVSPIQARFIAIALDHTLNKFSELALQEQEANNPGFVGSLLLERKEVAMAQLLLHLPLLRPDNYEAKQRYLTLLPGIISHSIETYSNVEEARQLLAYILIHPALKDAKGQFEHWRKALGELIIMNGSTSQASQASPASVSAPVNVSSGSSTVSNEGAFQQKVRRSNSLTPPFGITPPTEATSQDDISMVQGKTRRFSLSSDREVQSGGPPLSPQSSQASSGSGSEVHLDDLKANDNPGMKDLHSWLKTLRLHKYATHLSTLTYDQLMALNEDTFDQIIPAKVTQGARRKLLLSITKLRERYGILCKLEQDVINNGNLLIATEELKCILESPMRATPDDEKETVDDIPFHFTKVLGKVCTQLIVNGLRDEDSIYRIKNLLDVTLRHEAFVEHHRKISTWKAQIHKLVESRFSSPNMFLQPTRPATRSPPSWPIRYQLQIRSPMASALPLTGSAATSYQRNSLPVSSLEPSALQSNAMMFLAKRPSLQDKTLLELKAADSHSGIQRTQSAPPNPPISTNQPISSATSAATTSSAPAMTSLAPGPPSSVSEPEINTRLETLCRQMTEQALSGGAEN